MDQQRLQFGEFELRVSSYELRLAGAPVKLERIPMELLILLVEHRGELVSRDLIVQRLWGKDVYLETEHSINTAINKLRAVLQDHPKKPAFVQTVIGKGYRFVAEVKVIGPAMVLSPETTNEIASGPVIEPAEGTLSIAPQQDRIQVRTRVQESVAAPSAMIAPAVDAPQAASSVPSRPSRRILPAVLTLGLAAIFAMGLLHVLRDAQSSRPMAAPPVYRSVAVLPFTDLSPNSEREYLVDGMTDELITLLARGSSLRVISRTSTIQYKGVRRPLAEIATALKVDAIVEGSIMRDGKNVRITAQLLDAKRDQHLWAQTYKQSDKDPLLMQDQVAAEIAQQVAQRLGSEPTMIPKRIALPQAREFYLRGRYFCNKRTLDGLETSIDCYRRAIQADSAYAEPYAAMGEAYVLLASYGGTDPSKNLLLARDSAEKALRLDSSLGMAHTVLAAVKVDRDWNWQGAESEFRQAIALSPNDATAHHWYGLHLSRMRRYPEAEAEMQRALDLDPLSLIIQTDAAEVWYCARRPDEAQARLEKALELDANFAEAHLVLGKIYEQKRQFKQAVAEFERAAEPFGNSPNIEALRAHALALAGEGKKAQAIVDNLKAEATRRYVSGVDIALVYCALGNADEAMRWLDRGS